MKNIEKSTNSTSPSATKKWMNETDEASTGNKKIPPLKFSSFLKASPWVLVPDGNLLGFFSFVPKHLRIGPWSKTAVPTIALLTSVIAYYCPMEDKFYTEVESYPSAYSSYWWYNILTFAFMLGIITWSISLSTPAIVVAFTILSWNMNACRHGINALAPFLSDHHVLLKLNHILRFPALVSATLTFVVWNFVLVPYIYLMLMKTEEKKENFAIWNTSLRLVQFHFCNMIYAILNTLVTGNRNGVPPLFDNEDLWYGLSYGLGYSLFYVLVLDRIGIHLYPLFSPRSKFFAVAWILAFFSQWKVFSFWNTVIAKHLYALQFHHLLAFNFIVMGVGWFANKMLSKRKERNETTS